MAVQVPQPIITLGDRGEFQIGDRVQVYNDKGQLIFRGIAHFWKNARTRRIVVRDDMGLEVEYLARQCYREIRSEV